VIDMHKDDRPGGAALAPTSAVALAELADDARGYVAASLAPATRRAYATDWRLFSEWCDQRGLSSLPAAPETLALYLTDLAGLRSMATMARRLTAIGQAHRTAGVESPTSDPTVRRVSKGIRRTFGMASVGKAPARARDVRAMVATLDTTTPIGLRDRALLVVGFAGAFRRSELAALDVADVDWTDDGLVVHIRRSKIDQEGEGASVGLPYGSDPQTCPVRTLRAWLDAAGVADGPIFRSATPHGQITDRRLPDEAVAHRLQRAARAAGLDASRLAAHSLRVGLITSAAEAGVSERDIMRHSRHKSVAVLRGYIRDVGLFDANAAAAVGL
jgi:site-specific recombinase XerD